LPSDLKLQTSEYAETPVEKFLEGVHTLVHLLNSFDKKTLNEKVAAKLETDNPQLLEKLKAALTDIEDHLDELKCKSHVPFFDPDIRVNFVTSAN
jgi:methionyl-tRNA synthetase